MQICSVCGSEYSVAHEACPLCIRGAAVQPDTKTCPFCSETIKAAAIKCRFCGEQLAGADAGWRVFKMRYQNMSPAEKLATWNRLTPEQRAHLGAPSSTGVATLRSAVPKKSDVAAFLLGLFLGPVGLWYKGNWAAGFAWLAMAVLVALSGVGLLFVPFFWVGMAIHAAVAKTRE